MKTLDFWRTLCLSAAMLTAGAMVSCEPEDSDKHDDSLPYINVDLVGDSINAVDLEGGEVHFKVESNGDWTVEATDENGTYYTDVEFSETHGTGGTPDLKVTVGKWDEERDIYVTFYVTKVINNRVLDDSQTIVIFQNAEGELAEPTGIAAIYANNISGEYTVEDAWVVANYESGFVMTDDSGAYMHVYLFDSNTKTTTSPIPAVGTKLATVTGTIEVRNASNGSFLQYNNTATYTTDGTVEVNLGEPKSYDFAAMEAYGKLTGANLKPVYVKYTGTLSVSGSYYNVLFAEGDSTQGSIQYPNADLNVASYNGKVIDVTGFLIGYSSSGKYISTCVTEVAENTSVVTLSVNPKNLSFEATGNEAKVVTLTTQNADGLTPVVTFEGDGADAFHATVNGLESVSVTADDNTGEARSATMTVTLGTASATVSVYQSGVSNGEEKVVTITRELVDAAIPDLTTNGYGSQVVGNTDTYLSWTFDNITFKACRMCKAPENGDYKTALQCQGNASDTTKQALLYNETSLGKVSKVVVVSLNTSSNTPNFNFYYGTTEFPDTNEVKAADGTLKTENADNVTRYTTTFNITGDNGFIAIRNNTTGALYIEKIEITYAK